MMGRYGSAQARWEGVGPYYAMFPVAFANRVIAQHSRPGDVVLDPFAGRGTAVFSAAVQNRVGIGIEINPVGWVYAQAKLNPARRSAVEKRIRQIGQAAQRWYGPKAQCLPMFFKKCYRNEVRKFLVAAREELDWRGSTVDRTVMALLLVHLHGKAGGALSNQMRQTKAMSPDYAIRWWNKHNSEAPDLDPVEYMVRRLSWRYAQGTPPITKGSRAYLGNSIDVLDKLKCHTTSTKISLLFTSPPYLGVTNYHYDQWLRLWLLGEQPNALRKTGTHRGKFESTEKFAALLHDVFSRAARIAARDATIYVRTGRQESTHRVTRAVLRDVFSRHRMIRHVRPFVRPTQTQLFGDYEQKLGEADLILVRE